MLRANILQHSEDHFLTLWFTSWYQSHCMGTHFQCEANTQRQPLWLSHCRLWDPSLSCKLLGLWIWDQSIWCPELKRASRHAKLPAFESPRSLHKLRLPAPGLWSIWSGRDSVATCGGCDYYSVSCVSASCNRSWVSQPHDLRSHLGVALRHSISPAPLNLFSD